MKTEVSTIGTVSTTGAFTLPKVKILRLGNMNQPIACEIDTFLEKIKNLNTTKFRNLELFSLLKI